MLSPVPFGVGCYHPIKICKMDDVWRLEASPVPFGVGCYHPVAIIIPHNVTEGGVTSAFRRGVLSPPRPGLTTNRKWASCHQCLSAWGAITPSRLRLKSRRSLRLRHQCLSAWGAITPTIRRLVAARRLPVSPVPFGVGCYHPWVLTQSRVSVRRLCHQCLSAWGAITPGAWGSLYSHYHILSPVPFGVGCYHPRGESPGPRARQEDVTSAFRRGVLSPL